MGERPKFNFSKDNQIPGELQKELDGYKRRGKFYALLTVGVMSLFLFLGLGWFKAQGSDSPPYSYDSSLASFVSVSGSCCEYASPASLDSMDSIKAQALIFYEQKYNDADVTVKVWDYGCHIQADIFKDGDAVKSFSYDEGKFYEI